MTPREILNLLFWLEDRVRERFLRLAEREAEDLEVVALPGYWAVHIATSGARCGAWRSLWPWTAT